jgi:hypothetical protein
MLEYPSIQKYSPKMVFGSENLLVRTISREVILRRSSYMSELAPQQEQDILHQILRERGCDPGKLKQCEVQMRPGGRRTIAFDNDDFCNLGGVDTDLAEEFNRRRVALPE